MINLFSVSFQTFVHCRRDFNRVSFKGHWNCRGVGPNAWNEGVALPSFLLNVKLCLSDNWFRYANIKSVNSLILLQIHSVFCNITFPNVRLLLSLLLFSFVCFYYFLYFFNFRFSLPYFRYSMVLFFKQLSKLEWAKLFSLNGIKITFLSTFLVSPLYSLVRIPLESLLFLMVALVWLHVPAAWWV